MLAQLSRDGRLPAPVVGVAASDWDDDQLRGGAFYDHEVEGQREPACARLFAEAMDGQQRLFARADGVEAAGRIVEPVLTDHPPAHAYEPGTWGPSAADELIAGDGGWHEPLGG